MSSDLAQGVERTSRYPITAEMSPPHLHPTEVLSTSTLVALMEQTALDSVAGLLAPGETTVGTSIDLRHRRPAFPGETLEVRSRLVSVDRRLTFEIEARVADRVIGTATHDRAIVETASFASGG